MPEIARTIEGDLRKHLKVFYDDKGAVGRRYRRQDEAELLTALQLTLIPSVTKQ